MNDALHVTVPNGANFNLGDQGVNAELTGPTKGRGTVSVVLSRISGALRPGMRSPNEQLADLFSKRLGRTKQEVIDHKFRTALKEGNIQKVDALLKKGLTPKLDSRSRKSGHTVRNLAKSHSFFLSKIDNAEKIFELGSEVSFATASGPVEDTVRSRTDAPPTNNPQGPFGDSTTPSGAGTATHIYGEMRQLSKPNSERSNYLGFAKPTQTPTDGGGWRGESAATSRSISPKKQGGAVISGPGLKIIAEANVELRDGGRNGVTQTTLGDSVAPTATQLNKGVLPPQTQVNVITTGKTGSGLLNPFSNKPDKFDDVYPVAGDNEIYNVLRPQYVGEHTGQCTDTQLQGRTVKYFEAQDLEKYEVEVGRNGLLYYKHNHSLVDTFSASDTYGHRAGMYVWDTKDDILRIYNGSQETGFIHHSSLIAGRVPAPRGNGIEIPAAKAGGMMMVRNGQLIFVNRQTGHLRTTGKQLETFVNYMIRCGVTPNFTVGWAVESKGKDITGARLGPRGRKIPGTTDSFMIQSTRENLRPIANQRSGIAASTAGKRSQGETSNSSFSVVHKEEYHS